MLINLLIASYPLLVFILVAVAFHLFKLRTYLPLNVPDIVTFLLILGLHQVSRRVTHVSLLPYFLILLSAMALLLLLLDLFYYRAFSAKKFLYFFWRTTFFITLLLYICMVVVIFNK
jgi:hypothetical protein